MMDLEDWWEIIISFFFVMSINHDNLGFDEPIFFFND
jgi:hypothetical protein